MNRAPHNSLLPHRRRSILTSSLIKHNKKRSNTIGKAEPRIFREGKSLAQQIYCEKLKKNCTFLVFILLYICFSLALTHNSIVFVSLSLTHLCALIKNSVRVLDDPLHRFAANSKLNTFPIQSMRKRHSTNEATKEK